MIASKKTPVTIDAYIAAQPKHVQTLLKQIRAAIRQAAPAAQEAISYNMPSYKLHGNLVYFAAFKNHIGFYPTSNAIQAFQEKLGAYATSKGTIQFPLDKPLPLTLVKAIVKYRVKQNLAKAKNKK